MSRSKKLLQLKNLTKAFPGVVALDKVDFGLNQNEIHAIVGKNGAGKSTLISIISGVLQPDTGEIYWKGNEISVPKIPSLPVSTVYQGMTIFPNLSVADNIFAGYEPTSNFALVQEGRKENRTKELLKMFDINIPPNSPVTALSPAERKITEILRALERESEVLILDEPTATLTRGESQQLFNLLGKLKESGISVIYISHRLEEIFEIAERVTVLKNGKKQGAELLNDVTMRELVEMMVGEAAGFFEAEKTQKDEKIGENKKTLEVKNLAHNAGAFSSVSFNAYEGEILGLVGLVGAGKTELAKAIFGAEEILDGDIFLEGDKLNIGSPRGAIDNGIVYMTEDREEEGLFLEMPIKDNISSTILDEISKTLGFVDETKSEKKAKEAINQFDIQTYSSKQIAATLSGGNRQKVLLATWLQLNPKVLLVDEPTAGIDVQTKADIYSLLEEIADTGTTIIIISSEVKEILNQTERILTMYRGKITGELLPENTTEGEILEYISSSSPNIKGDSR